MRNTKTTSLVTCLYPEIVWLYMCMYVCVCLKWTKRYNPIAYLEVTGDTYIHRRTYIERVLTHKHSLLIVLARLEAQQLVLSFVHVRVRAGHGQVAFCCQFHTHTVKEKQKKKNKTAAATRVLQHKTSGEKRHFILLPRLIQSTSSQK